MEEKKKKKKKETMEIDTRLDRVVEHRFPVL